MQTKIFQNIYSLVSIKSVVVIWATLLPFLSRAQLDVETYVLEKYVGLDLDAVDENFISSLDVPTKSALRTLKNLLYHDGTAPIQDSIGVYEQERSQGSETKDYLLALNKAYYHLNYKRREVDVIKYIDSAWQLSRQAENVAAKKLSLIAALKFFNRENTQDKRITTEYLKKYEKLAQTTVDSSWINMHWFLQEGRIPKNHVSNFREYGQVLTNYFEKNEKKLSIGLQAQILENIGVFQLVIGNRDKAKENLMTLVQLPPLPYVRVSKFNGHLDLSRLLSAEGNFSTARYHLDQAYNNINWADLDKNLVTFNKFRAHYYHHVKGEHDSAYIYLNEAFNLNRRINYEEISAQTSRMNKILNVAQKDKELVEQRSELDRQRILRRNLIVFSSLFIGISSLIAYLIYRNTKRKQRIAEQEKELQIQKTTTVLKEQEINTINAMVEGQEKERLRLARDLHDHLGGTLAAVKMHIGNLQHNLHKSQNPQELLDKAEVLIAEAYKNVRSIAHERNSGVMAKEGLLPAIQKLARKVSSASGLQIEVQDFGLEERLSNHLEITIFRIVQELVTNIIKHAQASEAQISLTQHEEELNIVVEDNGRGFKVGKLKEKDGMGLGSIERRVEHLEGTMLVDSTPGKGTNIIIDIPI